MEAKEKSPAGKPGLQIRTAGESSGKNSIKDGGNCGLYISFIMPGSSIERSRAFSVHKKTNCPPFLNGKS